MEKKTKEVDDVILGDSMDIFERKKIENVSLYNNILKYK